MRGRDAERGIALPMVLSVLLCLLAVAIPFALSMRHEQNSATSRVERADARAEAELLQRVAGAQVRWTAPDVDPTPYWDTQIELRPDLDQVAQELGFDDLGPRGRLWSVEVEDLSGKVDLNAVPIHVVARLLGMSTRLVRSIDAEADEIRVEDGELFGDSGYLWIDGEVCWFGGRNKNTLYQLVRPAQVPGVFQPADHGDFGPRAFEGGTEVLDFRAWMIAHRVFRGGADPAALWENVDQAMAIAVHQGVGALEPRHLNLLRRHFRTRAADGSRSRWVDPQRVANAILAGESRQLIVGSGQYYGPGTSVRMTTRGGHSEIGLVLRSNRQDNGSWQLQLEMPPLFDADPWEAIVESAYRRPINVNTASAELIASLLVDLPRPQADIRVDRDLAEQVAAALIAARPLQGARSVDAVLDQMVTDDELPASLRAVIYANSHHAGDIAVGLGTLPFDYTTEGVVAVQSGASLNFALSGKEKSRAFVHEVLSVSGEGPSLLEFHTQRDFEDPWRLTRRARGWTTFPENLQLYHPSEAFVDPPGRIVGENYWNLNRFPDDEKDVNVGARLAPGRLTGYASDRVGMAQGMPGFTDVTLHFDMDPMTSTDVDGWPLSDGPPQPLPVSGGNFGGGAETQNARGAGRPDMVQITSNPSSQSFLRPFGVSMWWNPGDSLSPCTLFDTGVENSRNRVRLHFDGQQMVFEVFSSELPAVFFGPQEAVGRIRYAFEGNPPLETDTWYHVTAYCRGNRASQMSLWVDQRPRGTRELYAHLRSSAGEGRFTDPITYISDNGIQVEHAEDFPQTGVIKIGGEVCEYTSFQGGGFRFDPESDDPLFGGRVKRGSVEVRSEDKTHSRTPTGVELYGYSTPVSMDVPTGAASLSDELGKFAVAMVDPSSAQDLIEVQAAQIGNFPLGQGIEKDLRELNLVTLDQNGAPPVGSFQASGGYAVLVSADLQDRQFRIGQNIVTLNQTTQGSKFHGLELISYTSYNNGTMSGITRGFGLGARVPDVLTDAGNGNGNGNQQTGQELREPIAFLMNSGFLPALGFPISVKFLPVFVVPISLSVSDTTNFPIPSGVGAPEMVQVDPDFTSEEETSLEWFRYNSIDQVNHMFVRDDPRLLRRLRNALAGGRAGGNSLVAEIGGGNASYGENSQSYKDLMVALNYEAGLPEDVDRQQIDQTTGGGLAFRGVLGTFHCRHLAGAPVRPVWRVQRAGGPDSVARPGRHDEVTLVDAGGRTSGVPYEITYSYCRNAPGFGGVSHIALRDPVQGNFRSTLGLGGGNNQLSGDSAYVYANETRLHTRILKFPSGEMPGQLGGVLTLGQDFDGGGTSAAALIDEVRVFGAPNPDELTPGAMMVLEQELNENDSQADVHEGVFRFPHGTRASGYGGGPNGLPGKNYGPMDLMPDDGCVIQIGDEIILVREVDRGDVIANLDFDPDGRGAFGTEPMYHHAGTPLMVLPWFVVSRLNRGMGATDPDIDLLDVRGFPKEGFVMIDDEVLGYTSNLSARPGNSARGILRVPTYFFGGEGDSGGTGQAAFRGRYGTRATGHDRDSLVFWLPHRYPDWYADRADFPELSCLELKIDARRAWWDSLAWNELSQDGGSTLKALVRVQGRGRFHHDPEDPDDDLFLFEQPTAGDGAGHPLGRQGDQLVIRFFTEYRNGAMQPTDMTSNAWKRAPKLENVLVRYFGDTTVEEHSEVRR